VQSDLSALILGLERRPSARPEFRSRPLVPVHLRSCRCVFIVCAILLSNPPQPQACPSSSVSAALRPHPLLLRSARTESFRRKFPPLCRAHTSGPAAPLPSRLVNRKIIVRKRGVTALPKNFFARSSLLMPFLRCPPFQPAHVALPGRITSSPISTSLRVEMRLGKAAVDTTKARRNPYIRRRLSFSNTDGRSYDIPSYISRTDSRVVPPVLSDVAMAHVSGAARTSTPSVALTPRRPGRLAVLLNLLTRTKGRGTGTSLKRTPPTRLQRSNPPTVPLSESVLRGKSLGRRALEAPEPCL